MDLGVHGYVAGANPLLNIIIRCSIAGKLKITDLASHSRSPRNYLSRTAIQPPIAASTPSQRKRPSSISPVSVRPPAPGSPLPLASTPRARTPGRSSMKRKCVPRWSHRAFAGKVRHAYTCLLYTSPSPRDQRGSRMPSSA